MVWGWNVQTLEPLFYTFLEKWLLIKWLWGWEVRGWKSPLLRTDYFKEDSEVIPNHITFDMPLHKGLALLCITFKIETFVCHSFVVDVLLGWPSCYCTPAWDFMSKWIIVAHFFVYLQLICNHYNCPVDKWGGHSHCLQCCNKCWLLLSFFSLFSFYTYLLDLGQLCCKRKRGEMEEIKVD